MKPRRRARGSKTSTVNYLIPFLSLDRALIEPW
jgi:hypothetical protein